MFEKCKKFIKVNKRKIIRNDSDKFKRDLAEVIEEIVEAIEDIRNEL